MAIQFTTSLHIQIFVGLESAFSFNEEYAYQLFYIPFLNAFCTCKLQKMKLIFLDNSDVKSSNSDSNNFLSKQYKQRAFILLIYILQCYI